VEHDLLALEAVAGNVRKGAHVIGGVGVSIVAREGVVKVSASVIRATGVHRALPPVMASAATAAAAVVSALLTLAVGNAQAGEVGQAVVVRRTDIALPTAAVIAAILTVARYKGAMPVLANLSAAADTALSPAAVASALQPVALELAAATIDAHLSLRAALVIATSTRALTLPVLVTGCVLSAGSAAPAAAVVSAFLVKASR